MHIFRPYQIFGYYLLVYRLGKFIDCQLCVSCKLPCKANLATINSYMRVFLSIFSISLAILVYQHVPRIKVSHSGIYN